MLGKHKQSGTPSVPAVDMKATGVPVAQESEVRALLAKGSTKSAMELAKQIHKRLGTQASEALLVDAYRARIRSLMEIGLAVEAQALLELVRERYPSAKERLADVGGKVAVRQDGWASRVGGLNDPALPPEQRTEIENLIKRQLTDLSDLAECAALPPAHPLRAGAAALRKAFEAVTRGPVTDDVLLLPEVSRRGPLAPWKTLVWAMAHFYLQEDAACERCLEAIDPDSGVARLVPAIRYLLGGGPEDYVPSNASALLIAWVGGKNELLRSALQLLDLTFAEEKQGKIIPEIRRVTSICRDACPELMVRLRQHISIRAAKLNLSVNRVQAAMGGPAVRDAYFWRLFARMVETSPNLLSIQVVSMWEQFRVFALAEGWFPEDGPEAAAIYLHMAEFLLLMPGEELEQIREGFISDFPGYTISREVQPEVARAVAEKQRAADYYYLFPDRLFERACAIDPHRETFEKWLDWARGESGWKAAERVAERWHEALPNDSRPLLYLMESTEKRGALNKAISYLEQAESLDSLSPEVRRAALRLLVAQAIRHLRQRKPHLADQKLTALEALPQAQEADRPAFLAGLRWLCCILCGQAEAAIGYFTKVSELLGGPAAATLTCGSMGEACGFKQGELSPFLPQKHLSPQSGPIDRLLSCWLTDKSPKSSSAQAESLAATVARACALGDDMGVAFTIPTAFEREILKELKSERCALEARALRTLAEAALRRNLLNLAYAASAAGLRKGGATEARFLLLRARVLPEWEFERRKDCIVAATELARRQRDMALVDEAVELRRSSTEHGMDLMDWVDTINDRAFSLTTEQLNAVVKREKRLNKFPVYRPSSHFEPFEGEEDETEELEFEEFSQLLEELGQTEGKPYRRKKGRRDFRGQRSLF
jgi:tetratricopeptide (TPR) repeat protein